MADNTKAKLDQLKAQYAKKPLPELKGQIDRLTEYLIGLAKAQPDRYPFKPVKDRAQLHRALDTVMDRVGVGMDAQPRRDAGLNIAPKVTRDATICHKCGQIVRCKEGCFKPHSIPGPNNGQTCSGSYKAVGTER